MSTGVYALARFLHSENLLPAVDVLAATPAVKHWDAVDGHAHLAIQIDTTAKDVPPEVLNLGGLAELHIAEIIREWKGGTEPDPMECRSLVFLETEPGKAGEMQEALSLLSGLIQCTETSGPFDLVCTIQGGTFDAIQRVIDTSIHPLDGVVRIRQNRIIDLSSL